MFDIYFKFPYNFQFGLRDGEQAFEETKIMRKHNVNERRKEFAGLPGSYYR